MKNYFAGLVLFAFVFVPVSAVHAADAAVINSVSAKAAPEGIIYSGEKAYINGTGLSGSLLIQVGNQEPKYVQITNESDTVAEFTVPYWSYDAGVSLVVTNASGVKSNYYQANIRGQSSGSSGEEGYTPPTPSVSGNLPTTAASITNIQSAANPPGVIDAGHRASLYGTGLSGPLTVHIGIQDPVSVATVGASDGFAEFMMPKRSQSESTVVTVVNASGKRSNEVRITIQVDRELSVETSSVEELIRKGGRYDAHDFVKKVGTLKVLPGAIEIETRAIPTTNTTLLTTIGNTEIEIQPTAKEVVIQEKELKVTAEQITITKDQIEVEGNPVSISATEAAAALDLVPESVKLHSSEQGAVYDMKTNEDRKLFGFIPLSVPTTVVASAHDAEFIKRVMPWYGFLTTEVEK